MTKEEINQVLEDVLNLYIKMVKQYYNQPRYTERPQPHTMIDHLWWVLEKTKKDFLALGEKPNEEVPSLFTEEEIDQLYRGGV